MEKDSLLFNLGFNNCDIDILKTLVDDDFTFFHDLSGITNGKKDFIEGVQFGLCEMPYKAVRELIPESVTIYPLDKDNVLYGVIQMGNHNFYAIEGENVKYLTSMAKFTHVWLLVEGHWKLHSVLSYDHQPAEK
jgi:hypothetical protein